MTTKRIAALIGVLGLALGVAACGHINNPFTKAQAGKYKGSGTRIPVIAFDQSLKVADALKGAASRYTKHKDVKTASGAVAIDNGMTAGQVGEAFGFSRQLASRYLKEARAKWPALESAR